MTDSTFRIRLMALLNEFLAEGGDAQWLFGELNVAGTQLTDALRCDLVEIDEQVEEPPY
jgi:hypothetical protein